MTTPVDDSPTPLAVLISGRGSNMRAIGEAVAEGRLQAIIRVVISSRPDAPGLQWARDAGIETLVLEPGGFESRDAYDRALIDAAKSRGVKLVCLAGFMRLVGPAFCDAFPNAVLNVHPSLLPAFAGKDAQGQALAHGVKVSGVTVHFVTPELDAGPIIQQAAVPVRDDDTRETLSTRILVEEHRIYPEAIQKVIEGGWRLEGRRVLGVS
jgi:phosphoribosylglycinamide formyltransferase 1